MENNIDEDIKIVEQMIEEATAEALSYDTYCYEIKVEQVEAMKNILNFIDLIKDLETHIPKDIEILKSFNAGDEYTEKIKQAIENALDYIDRTEHTRKLACGFKKLNDKKAVELETYKKIAENLAVKLINVAYYNYEIDDLIDWARKEVEKDE